MCSPVLRQQSSSSSLIPPPTSSHPRDEKRQRGFSKQAAAAPPCTRGLLGSHRGEAGSAHSRSTQSLSSIELPAVTGTIGITKSQRGCLGEGNLPLRFPAVRTCCQCSAPCPPAGGISVLLHLSVLVLYLLWAESGSTPAIPATQQLLSLPGPHCSLLGHVLSGNLGSSPPRDSSSSETHYANQSRGNV